MRLRYVEDGMHRLISAAFTIAIATTTFSGTADADCMTWGLAPKILTPANSMLTSAAGGIVVAVEPKAGIQLAPGDQALQPTWRFKGNRKAPAITSLAPGLAVIGVPMQSSVELVDGAGKSLLVVAAPAAEEQRKASAAPKVKQVIYKSTGNIDYHGAEATTVVLAAPMPQGTVAVILRDDKGAKSFGLVTDPTSLTVAAYSHAYCQALPNGTRPSKTGDIVSVQFVERDGFTSAASTPIKISAAP